MKYQGRHPLFDSSGIRTYPLKVRNNKVEVGGFADLKALREGEIRYPAQPWFRNGYPGGGPTQEAGLSELAAHTVKCWREGKPVAVLSGAHPIKNGQNPIVIDLINRGIVTQYATNCASVIHSFELALTGASSEAVRDALPRGEFGMAFETGAYLNVSMTVGHERGLGFGESVCRFLCDAEFRREVIDRVFQRHRDTGEYYKPYEGFPFEDTCVLSAAYKKGIPVTIHSMPGADIIDQHPTFDGEAKGAGSGTDFLIFTEAMTRFTNGGVILNIGSAVMGPEIALKALSMIANVGKKPDGLWTGDFDVRPFVFDDDVRDEDKYYYYFRDQKSIATRIPKVFGGVGFYFQGLHRETLPPFYQRLLQELGERS